MRTYTQYWHTLAAVVQRAVRAHRARAQVRQRMAVALYGCCYIWLLLYMTAIHDCCSIWLLLYMAAAMYDCCYI